MQEVQKRRMHHQLHGRKRRTGYLQSLHARRGHRPLQRQVPVLLPSPVRHPQREHKAKADEGPRGRLHWGIHLPLHYDLCGVRLTSVIKQIRRL